MDDTMDLIVWFDEEKESIVGFQLAYDQGGLEHALTWKSRTGFQHEKVDDGERRPGKYKAAPILLPDGDFCASAIANLFQENAARIDAAISGFVHAKLLEYPGRNRR